MTPRARIILLLAFGTSVGLHGVAYASLAGAGGARIESAPPPHSQLRFDVKEKPAPDRAPLPESKPEPALPSSRTAARTTPAPLVTAVEKPSSTPPAAVDLSGVTLTNDSGSGFAMPVGDGTALRAPIVGGRVANAALPAFPAPRAAEPALPSGPALVAAADLSEHPRPPSLEGLLRANYPDDAKQRGLRGSARVRARIDADGVVRSAQLSSESAPGFGAACRRTVLGSRWSAPKDKNGGAVATEIVYTCHFEVGQ